MDHTTIVLSIVMMILLLVIQLIEDYSYKKEIKRMAQTLNTQDNRINLYTISKIYDKIKESPKGGKSTADALFASFLKGKDLGKASFKCEPEIDPNETMVMEFSIDDMNEWLEFFELTGAKGVWEVYPDCTEFRDEEARINYRFMF